MFDLSASHDKDVAKHRVEESAFPFLGSNRPLRDHHVVFFNGSCHLYGRSADKRIILDFFIESLFSDKMENSWQIPHNVIG